jgi:hypothetical protein
MQQNIHQDCFPQGGGYLKRALIGFAREQWAVRS